MSEVAAATSLSDGGDAFERALFMLAVGGKEPQRIEGVDGDLAVVFDARTRRRTVLVRVREEIPPAVLERLTDVLRRLSKGAKGSVTLLGPVDVVVLGGTRSVRASLKRLIPSLTVTRVTLYHLAHGDSVAWRYPGFFGGRASALPFAFGTIDAGYDRTTLERRIADDLRRADLESREIAPFLERVARHRGVVTACLLVVTAAAFLVEKKVPESRVSLVRMGAMVGHLAFHGEWWRFGAYLFLHLGWLHVVMNGFVLLVLGKWVEGIFGSWRFLVLYGLAGLGGGLASGVVHPEQVTVGASGAIWGLFGAQAVLAYRPRGVLPSSMIPGARRAARQNLIANLLISTLPGVSMAAHLGGGIVGVGLVLSGALTRGLPPSTDAASEGDASARSPIGIACSVGVGALLIVALAVGLVRGRVWTLDDPPQMTRRVFPNAGVQMDLPLLLEPSPEKPVAKLAGAFTQTFGNGLTDPATIIVLELPRSTPEEDSDALTAEIEKQFSQPPENMKLSLPLTRKQNANGRAFFVSFTAASGAVYERGVALLPGGSIVVDSITWPTLRHYQGLPERALSSLAALPTLP